MVSSSSIAIMMLIVAASELSLSAIGLSFVTRIAPKGFVSIYMGIWLVTLGLGGKVGGYIAQYAEKNNVGHNSLLNSKMQMIAGSWVYIAIMLVSCLLCFIGRYFYKRFSNKSPSKLTSVTE